MRWLVAEAKVGGNASRWSQEKQLHAHPCLQRMLLRAGNATSVQKEVEEPLHHNEINQPEGWLPRQRRIKRVLLGILVAEHNEEMEGCSARQKCKEDVKETTR